MIIALCCKNLMTDYIFQSSRSNILKANTNINNPWHPAMEVLFEKLHAKFEASSQEFEGGVAF